MRNKKYLLSGLAAAALAFHLFAGIAFIRVSAPTYDEPVHLIGGYSYLVNGRFLMDQIGHPPLSEALSALPLLALKLNTFASHPYSINGQVYHYAHLFFYNNSVGPERLINTARTGTFLLWMLLLAVFLYVFASRLSGPAAAAFSVMAFCFMPAFISNNALITTDAAAAVFYLGAVAAAYRFASLKGDAAVVKSSRPLYLWAITAGALAGMAMLSKFSMFVLPPLITGMLLLDNFLDRGMKWPRAIGYYCLLLASALLMIFLVCRGNIGLYFDVMVSMLGRIDTGHSSFALGQYSLGGVWWYFPLAFAVKTPLAIVFLAGIGAVAVFRKPGRDWLWLLIPPAFYFAASLGTRLQIGYRHILPVMPFLALAAGLGAEYLMARRKWRLIFLAAALCAAWGWGMHRLHPYYLAYFNELAGGPANGYKFLVDSNLDWGQDVKTLGRYLKNRGNPPVIFSYFGVAKPENYGIDYTQLGPVLNVKFPGTGVQVCSMKQILLAVSATNLQSVYYPDRQTFSWLKERRPVFSAGHSIFFYDLSADKGGLEELAGLFDREGRNAEAECLYQRAAGPSDKSF
ncbi:MAG: hypothetical protein A2234_01355 [Elusimicrobia bacterium RIFOXYA2_FULL_58_8]|nr:MAG: hypothetical protein A2285_06410 [Elusimicrobia bacterium RIFOXYA12_FULL_57_11]OGS15360.1 MAG: hypothetical protein A2234_01355 [Elusimicrobia bacterium RIFOXYA2_FULL_58_8]